MVMPPDTVSESLVQVTVVAGPPVEVQVRVNRGLSPLRSEFIENVIPPDMMTSPANSYTVGTGYIVLLSM